MVKYCAQLVDTSEPPQMSNDAAAAEATVEYCTNKAYLNMVFYGQCLSNNNLLPVALTSPIPHPIRKANTA